MMNGNLADGLAPGPVAVWADGRVNGQCRITHSRPLPSRSTAPRPFRATESFHPSSVLLSFLFVGHLFWLDSAVLVSSALVLALLLSVSYSGKSSSLRYSSAVRRPSV